MFNFTIFNSQLERVFEIRDLGVVIDKTLSLLDILVLWLLRSFLYLDSWWNCDDFDAVTVLVFHNSSHVRSHLDYASVI